MAYLRPKEILDERHFRGHRYRDVAAMLQHYGFEAHSSGPSGGHINFTHREYKDIRPITIAYHSGELDKVYIQKACEVCLEVKAKNAARRERTRMEDVPEWVIPTLPPRAHAQAEGQELYITCNGTEAPARHYRLQYLSKRITIENLDFPSDVIHPMRYSVNEGEPRSHLTEIFAAYDDGVSAHMESREKNIHQLVKYLQDELGFTCERVEAEGLSLLKFDHPLYHIGESIIEPQADRISAVNTLATLRGLETQHEVRFYEQEQFKETMQAKGWSYVDATPPNGHAGSAAFVKGERRVELATHGILAMYDVQAVRKILEPTLTDTPLNVIHATPKPALTADQQALRKRVATQIPFRTITEVQDALRCVNARFEVHVGARGETVLTIQAPELKRTKPHLFGGKQEQPITFTSRFDQGIHESNQSQLANLLSGLIDLKLNPPGEKQGRKHG